MLVTLPPLKIQIRASRPPKVAIKQWVSWKGLYRLRRRERIRLAGTPITSDASLYE
jgi:hypothetical protein